jgi:hypothetical protein
MPYPANAVDATQSILMVPWLGHWGSVGGAQDVDLRCRYGDAAFRLTVPF